MRKRIAEESDSGTCEPRQNCGRAFNRSAHVIARRNALSQIVEQEGHAHEREAIFFFRQQMKTRRALRFREQIVDGLKRDERMLIDGVAMIEIADDQAVDFFPFRQCGREHAARVHGAHGESGVRLGEKRAPVEPGKRCAR